MECPALSTTKVDRVFRLLRHGRRVHSDSGRARSDSGTVLFLVPVAFLIVMLLGSIAADFSLVLQARRDLTEVAGAAANDAATRSIDVNVLETTGDLKFVSASRLNDVVNDTLARQSLGAMVITSVRVWDDTLPGSAEPRVAVELTATVNYVFAQAVPGIAHSRSITVLVHATAKISG